MPEEVKMSWSPRYILLIVVLSFLTGVVGFLLKAYFEPHESRVFTLTENTSPNLILLDARAQSGIIATYTLKDQPAQQLKSYFEHRIGLKNVGSVDAESIRVVVDVDDPKVKLIGPPSFTFSPPEQYSAVKITSEANLQNNIKNDWIISLLKPNEAIEMVFMAYSTDSPDTPRFLTAVRKKDWDIISSNEAPKQQTSTQDLKTIIIVIIMQSFLVLIGSAYIEIMFRRSRRKSEQRFVMENMGAKLK